MKDHAKKVQKVKAKYKYIHQGLDAEDRWYNGTLGELAFGKLLKQHKKKFDYNHKVELGNPDYGDFTLYNEKGKAKADVKTASQPRYVNMLVPTTQKKYPIYIGARLNGEAVEIHGYCQPDELSKEIKPSPIINSVGIRLDDLHPIEELLEILI